MNQTIKNKHAEPIWQLIKKLDEQRQYPRIPFRATVAVRSNSGAKCSMDLVNISPDGMQLRCSEQAIQTLQPDALNNNIKRLTRVSAAVVLPCSIGQRTVVARCALLYATAMPNEKNFLVGMRFSRLDPQAENALVAFFSDQLRIAEDC